MIKQSLELVQCLVSHGADPLQLNFNNETPLSMARSYGFTELGEMMQRGSSAEELEEPSEFHYSLESNDSLQDFQLLANAREAEKGRVEREDIGFGIREQSSGNVHEGTPLLEEQALEYGEDDKEDYYEF